MAGPRNNSNRATIAAIALGRRAPGLLGCCGQTQDQSMTKFPRGTTATPASIVDALNAVAGERTKVRASFAAGQCVHGTYIPSDRSVEITRSRSFSRPSRVLARFSMDGCNPELSGADRLSLRGFSFRLGRDDYCSDILTQSAPVHFARTLDQMQAYLKARIPDPKGKLDTDKVKAFSAANPETLSQADYLVTSQLPTGFAGATYWGVHSFPATNADDETRFIKLKIVPVGGDLAANANEATTTSASAIYDDLRNRIAAGEVRFSVIALLDRPNDPVLDVTIRWPDEDSRDEIRLGTIVITGVEANTVCDASVFDPANLAEGLDHPLDEIFAARRAAYAISLARRR